MKSKELSDAVEKALMEIRPFLQADGGDISLISIENDVVCIQLKGACLDCPVNQMTLKNGVEATIKQYAPQIKEVVELS